MEGNKFINCLLCDGDGVLHELDGEEFECPACEGEGGDFESYRQLEKAMLKIGDLVEVEKPFYWYGEERYEIGQRFIIEAQHIGHDFEAWVKKITA